MKSKINKQEQAKKKTPDPEKLIDNPFFFRRNEAIKTEVKRDDSA